MKSLDSIPRIYFTIDEWVSIIKLAGGLIHMEHVITEDSSDCRFLLIYSMFDFDDEDTPYIEANDRDAFIMIMDCLAFGEDTWHWLFNSDGNLHNKSPYFDLYQRVGREWVENDRLS